MEIRSRVSFPLLPASTIRMNKAIAILLLAFGVACFAKTAPDPKPQLIAMLNNFLAAASHTPASATDKAVFDQFFADDVIYTRAAGMVVSKSDIMRSLDEPPSPSDPVAAGLHRNTAGGLRSTRSSQQISGDSGIRWLFHGRFLLPF